MEIVQNLLGLLSCMIGLGFVALIVIVIVKVIAEDISKSKNHERSTKYGYEILKNEYSDFCKIVEKEIEKLEKVKSGYVISMSYLTRMHKYFQDSNLIRTNKKFSIELLSCFYKAVMEEPVFVCKRDRNKFDEVNRELVKNVVKATGYKLDSSKRKKLAYYGKLYAETRNEIYFLASFIIKDMI